jgi:hypothetical protein
MGYAISQDMEKFYLLQRNFNSGDVEFFLIEAEDIDKAYENVEENYSDTNSQEWLFEENSFDKLQKSLNKFLSKKEKSNCCYSPIEENSDICSKCKEHCGMSEEEAQENFCN